VTIIQEIGTVDADPDLAPRRRIKSHHASFTRVALVWNDWVTSNPLTLHRSSKTVACSERRGQNHRLAGMPQQCEWLSHRPEEKTQ
jgi:hypothetical protein